MTTLLLTGATGLVGSRLLPRLVEAGSTAARSSAATSTLPRGRDRRARRPRDPDSLRAAVEGVDAVVHLAALFRTTDEDAIWRANLDGTRNLVDAVKAHAPQARFVMASTGNVYNADAARPSRETDACSPTAAYPASKLAAEALLRDSGLTWSILRLPFVYGDGDGHLASMPALAPRFGLHPAHTYSVMHHRDVAPSSRLALTRSHGRPDRQRHRRRARHRLRDGIARRASRSRARRSPWRTHGRGGWTPRSCASWASGRRCRPSRRRPPRGSSRRAFELPARPATVVVVQSPADARSAGPSSSAASRSSWSSSTCRS